MGENEFADDEPGYGAEKGVTNTEGGREKI